MSKQKEIKKEFNYKKILTLIRYLIIILLTISSFTYFFDADLGYQNYINTHFNWFTKLYIVPTLEGIRILNFIMPLNLAYIVFLILGMFLIYPLLSNLSNLILKLSKTFKGLKEISNTKVETEQEQINKVNKMLDFYEENGISLFNFLLIILNFILGVGFLSAIFSNALVLFDLFNESNKFLWFNIIGEDNLYILPSTALIFGVITPFIENLINYKKAISKEEKTKIIYKIFIITGAFCFLVPGIFLSSVFALFIILNYARYWILKGITFLIQKKKLNLKTVK